MEQKKKEEADDSSFKELKINDKINETEEKNTDTKDKNNKKIKNKETKKKTK